MIRISLRKEVLVLVTTGRAIFCLFDVFQQDCLVAMMVLPKNLQPPISSTFGQGLQVELLQKTCGTGLVICPLYTTAQRWTASTLLAWVSVMESHAVEAYSNTGQTSCL